MCCIPRDPALRSDRHHRHIRCAIGDGGGISGQALAPSLGIARALLENDANTHGASCLRRYADPRRSRSGKTQEVRTTRRAQAFPVLQALSRSIPPVQFCIPRKLPGDFFWGSAGHQNGAQPAKTQEKCDPQKKCGKDDKVHPRTRAVGLVALSAAPNRRSIASQRSIRACFFRNAMIPTPTAVPAMRVVIASTPSTRSNRTSPFPIRPSSSDGDLLLGK